MYTKKIFNLALKVFLLLSPIFLFRNYQVSYARGLFFVCGTFVLYCLSLGLTPKRKLNSIWLSVFLLFMLVRVFFSDPLSVVSVGTEWFNFWICFSYFIYAFCGVLLFHTIYTHADGIKQYLFPILIVCLFNWILAVSQTSGNDFLWTYTNLVNIPNGFMETPMQLGQYSAMAIPILFFINPVLCCFPIVTMVLGKSVTPILSVLVVASFLVWKLKNKILFFSLIIVLVLVAWFKFPYIEHKWKTRPIMWAKTLKVALGSPYLGTGHGTFNEKVVNNNKLALGSTGTAPSQNDYLHTAQEFGFPLLIIVFMFFMGITKKFIKEKNKSKLLICLASSVSIVLINMFGQSFIRHASISGTFIVLLAFLCIELDSNAKEMDKDMGWY